MGWEDAQRERREQEKVAAQAKFEPWVKFLSLAEFGWKSRTFLRVNRAASDVREQRRLSGYRGGDYDQPCHADVLLELANSEPTP